MNRQIDCSNLQCPMPIVRISLTVKEMQPGEVLEVQATDPAFEADLRAWSEMTGNRIQEFQEGPPMRALVEVS